MLYELIAGARAYEGVTRSALFESILRKEPERPTRIPSDLWVVTKTALAKEPDQRFASAGDLAEDLRRVRMHEPIKARPIGPLKRTVRWTRRHPAASLVMLLTIGGVIAFTVQQQRAAHRLQMEKAQVEQAQRQAERRAYLANIHAAAGSLASHDASEADRRLLDCPTELRGWEWHYLSNALDQSVAAPKAFNGRLHKLAQSRDGTVLAVAGSDRTVQVWDPTTMTRLRYLQGLTRHGAVSLDVSRMAPTWSLAGRTTASRSGRPPASWSGA